MRLSGRLAAVAQLALSGESVLDVGTDHGYLPVYFAEEGLFRRIAASDIRPGPLAAAVENARAAGVYGRIDFYLSDGLTSVPGSFDTVVIAGMGGETMVDIISECPWAGRARLVLQPQSKLRELCGYLDAHGFVCVGARIAEDAGKLYTAFSARAGEGGFDLMGALMDRREPLLEKYLKGELARLNRAAAGMERASRREEGQLLDILRLREETAERLLEVEKWQR